LNSLCILRIKTVVYIMMQKYTCLCWLIGLCTFFVWSRCASPSHKAENQQPNVVKVDTIALPAKVQTLNEGLGQVFYIDTASTLTDTMVNGHSHMKVNGDVFFDLKGSSFPVQLYTSLMQITVLKPAAFRVSAYDIDQGQSVESLSGEIRIAKNYTSPFPEPDTLRENNLYMINCSIDLSEKEKLDDNQLATWWNQVKESEAKK